MTSPHCFTSRFWAEFPDVRDWNIRYGQLSHTVNATIPTNATAAATAFLPPIGCATTPAYSSDWTPELMRHRISLLEPLVAKLPRLPHQKRVPRNQMVAALLCQLPSDPPQKAARFIRFCQLCDAGYLVAPKSRDTRGRTVALRGAENYAGVSCYLDSVLFAMFARSDSFDAVLLPEKSDQGICHNLRHRLSHKLSHKLSPQKKKLARLTAAVRLYVSLLRAGWCVPRPMTRCLLWLISEADGGAVSGGGQQDAGQMYSVLADLLEIPPLTLTVDVAHPAQPAVAEDHRMVQERLLYVPVPEAEAEAEVVAHVENQTQKPKEEKESVAKEAQQTEQKSKDGKQEAKQTNKEINGVAPKSPEEPKQKLTEAAPHSALQQGALNLGECLATRLQDAVRVRRERPKIVAEEEKATKVEIEVTNGAKGQNVAEKPNLPAFSTSLASQISATSPYVSAPNSADSASASASASVSGYVSATETSFGTAMAAIEQAEKAEEREVSPISAAVTATTAASTVFADSNSAETALTASACASESADTKKDGTLKESDEVSNICGSKIAQNDSAVSETSDVLPFNGSALPTGVNASAISLVSVASSPSSPRKISVPAWMFSQLVPFYTNLDPNSASARRFAQLWPVLPFALMQYGWGLGGGRKKAQTVAVPPVLYLPNFICEDLKAPLQFKLVLESVVCHRGAEVASGHFVSIVAERRRKRAQWLFFDDLVAGNEKVKPVEFAEVMEMEVPYLLFYRLQPMTMTDVRKWNGMEGQSGDESGEESGEDSEEDSEGEEGNKCGADGADNSESCRNSKRGSECGAALSNSSLDSAEPLEDVKDIYFWIKGWETDEAPFDRSAMFAAPQRTAKKRHFWWSTKPGNIEKDKSKVIAEAEAKNGTMKRQPFNFFSRLSKTELPNGNRSG